LHEIKKCGDGNRTNDLWFVRFILFRGENFFSAFALGANLFIEKSLLSYLILITQKFAMILLNPYYFLGNN